MRDADPFGPASGGGKLPNLFTSGHGTERVFDTLKRIFVGRPLATSEQEHQRIPKTIALAVFSSDAISSTAYATEEILFVTVVGTSSLALGLNALIPISIAVALLLAIVTTSYRQTIFAYPSGGGSYVVSRENLGENPSLVAGASLLVDYILTVAVSISAGVAAIISIPQFESLANHRVELGLALIVLITLANLRGIKESGRHLRVPDVPLHRRPDRCSSCFGLTKSFFGWFGGISTIPYDPAAVRGGAASRRHAQPVPDPQGLLVGRGRADRCRGDLERRARVPPPGVEERGRPRSRAMAIILGTLFFGVSVLAHRLHPYPSHDITVFAQMGKAVFGDNVVFWILQLATAGILTLAANTAYADFPRLSSIIASDGYLPRQLANRGDRLVFSNGILVLATAAGVLIVAFGGVTNALIPLYAVGVFLSFTLSQTGMVRHHLKEREPHWKRGVAINAHRRGRDRDRDDHRRVDEVHERRVGAARA